MVDLKHKYTSAQSSSKSLKMKPGIAEKNHHQHYLVHYEWPILSLIVDFYY